MQSQVPENGETPALGFSPQAPINLRSLDIPESLVEDLILRRLYVTGVNSIQSLCSTLKLSFPVICEVFHRLREKQLLDVSGMEGNDYKFTLSAKGREYAGGRFHRSYYAGPAPVSSRSYYAAVHAQGSKVKLNRSSLRGVFSDLVMTDEFLDQLGPAIISQTSLFLYGPTGNGKTSVAERLSRIYDDAILIPYCVEMDEQIIVLYDPAVHHRFHSSDNDLDPRWVVCRRPCITVGGELEPGMLEMQWDETSRVYAAPLQMKANNGILIIDDFGRQLVSPKYLLNRWIVPLDRRVDYLTLSHGIKFEIPFEMVVVFASNLDPTDLADDAFLRRIQNKVHVGPIAPQVFDKIFQRVTAMRNLHCEDDSAAFCRELCMDLGGGALRACYPDDIINILFSISTYDERPAEVNKEMLRRAAELYFTKTA